MPRYQEQIAGKNGGCGHAPHRPRPASARRFPLCVLLLCAAQGGLTGRPPQAFAGDLPVPHLAASETDGLNLTPTQQKKLTALEADSRSQAHHLIGQIEKLRHTLSEAYEAYSVDLPTVRRANQDLNRVQGQLLDLRLSEQLQMRKILSPVQFAQLQAAIRKHEASREDRSHDPDDRHDSHKEAPPE